MTGPAEMADAHRLFAAAHTCVAGVDGEWQTPTSLHATARIAHRSEKCTTETGRKNPPELPSWPRLTGLDRPADPAQGPEMSYRFHTVKVFISKRKLAG
jgi:hypothetical protein